MALRERGDAKQSHVTAICDYDVDSFLPQLRQHYFLMQTPTILGQLCRSDAPQIPGATDGRGRVGLDDFFRARRRGRSRCRCRLLR